MVILRENGCFDCWIDKLAKFVNNMKNSQKLPTRTRKLKDFMIRIIREIYGPEIQYPAESIQFSDSKYLVIRWLSSTLKSMVISLFWDHDCISTRPCTLNRLHVSVMRIVYLQTVDRIFYVIFSGLDRSLRKLSWTWRRLINRTYKWKGPLSCGWLK